MSRRLGFSLVIVGSLAASASAGPTPLEGTWVEVLREPADRVGYRLARIPSTVVAEGDAWTEKEGGRPFRQSLLATGGRPAGHVDFMTVSSDRFWITRAIYKVEGDVLTIRESALEQERPADFRSDDPPGRLSSLRMFRRASAR